VLLERQGGRSTAAVTETEDGKGVCAVVGVAGLGLVGDDRIVKVDQLHGADIAQESFRRWRHDPVAFEQVGLGDVVRAG
jgi:hypothetical protein